MGWLCDVPWLSRPKRALVAWAVLFVYSNAVMGGGLAFENLREANPPAFIAFHSGKYAGGAMLYFFYGMLDSLWQGVSRSNLSWALALISIVRLLAFGRHVFDSGTCREIGRCLQGGSVNWCHGGLPAHRRQCLGTRPVHQQLGRCSGYASGRP